MISSTKDAYRPDVDGLRAIAVLAVVIFHAFPSKLGGGFVGVDVFFVISGFLISRHIIQELNRQVFSYLDFYNRRIRRIFPALLIMLAAFLVMGWFLILPPDYAQLGKSVAAGVGFLSNISSLSETGYFDKAAQSKPLLHLWSLGIEEQFYILWPLVLCFCQRWRLRYLGVTLFLIASSFALNVYLVRDHGPAAFYLPFTRFWELLIGCCLAVIGAEAEGWFSDMVSVFGMASILGGMALIREGFLFPGYFALFPSVGAGLLIFSGPSAWVNKRVLSQRAMVAIGLISYPLYLWHWPLLVFSNETFGSSRSVKLTALLLSFCLSAATYFFVEKPVRSRKTGKISLILVAAGIFVLCIGTLLWKTNGFDSRFPAEVNLIGKTYETAEIYRFKRCFLDSKAQGPESFSKGCSSPTPSGAASLLLWGDSHAAHLFPGFQAALDSSKIRLWQWTATSCPPLIGGETAGNGNCAQIEQGIENKIKSSRPQIVVLGSRWDRDVDHLKEKIEKTSKFLFQNGVKEVVLFGPPPYWAPSLSAVLLRAYRAKRKVPPRLPMNSEEFNKVKIMDQDLKIIARGAGMIYISAVDILCNSAGCMTLASGAHSSELISGDSDHYTSLASEFVVKAALPKILQNAVKLHAIKNGSQ